MNANISDFEWDERKNRTNIAKHRIAFDVAAEVFFDPFVLVEQDDRHNYGEIRFKAVGMVEGRVLAVVYTVLQERIRIISARKANAMSEKHIMRVRIDRKNPRVLTAEQKQQLERLDLVTDEEAHAAAVSDPDNPPMTQEELRRLRYVPNPRAIREKLGLTVEAFAEAFDLSARTVQRWELCPWGIQEAERVLLQLIERIPDTVRKALHRGDIRQEPRRF